MATFKTLGEVSTALHRSVPADSSFRSISTRILLRTGVNLREPRPDQSANPVAIAAVVAALVSMGFTL